MRAILLALLLVSPLRAQTPAASLPESASQRVQVLHGDLDRHLAENRLDAVRATVAEVRKVHADLPKDHWQRRSGEPHLATHFERLASLEDKQRQTYQQARLALERAEAASQAGYHAQAESTMTGVLTAYQTLFPSPSHQLADLYRQIAVVLRAAGKRAEARGYADASLRLMQQLWQEHPWVARAHLLLADLETPDGAEEHLRQAWELARRTLGPNGELTLGASRALVVNLRERSLERQADAAERVALLLELERSLGIDHADTLAACLVAAGALEGVGDSVAAEPHWRRVMSHSTRASRPSHEKVDVLNNLLRNLIRQNKLAEVEALAGQMLDLQKKEGDDHPNTPTVWFAHGEALLAVKKFDVGMQSLNRGLELRRKQFGDDHPGTINAYNRVANALDDLGRYAEAEPFYRQAVERGIKLAGVENANVAAIRCNLGNCLLQQHKLEEADKCLSEVVATFTKLEAMPGPGSATALINLAGVRLAQQRLDDALALYQRAHDALKASDERHALYPRVLGYLGTTLLSQGKLDAAEQHLLSAMEQHRKLNGAASPPHALAQIDQVDLLLRRHKPAIAEKLARLALSGLEKSTPGTGEHALALTALARTLDAQNKPTDAEPMHRRAAEMLQTRQIPLARQGKTLAALGAHLHQAKRAAEAEPILRRAHEALSLDPLTLAAEREETSLKLQETLLALGKTAEAQQIRTLKPR